ncbi:MAG: citrate lyase acyl carrier protein [Prevotella sp.]|jgi:citrate lyase subunit gamma (acyl carrier protein)
MELKDSFAGTLESGDILIQIAPSENDALEIELDSTVAYQFGAQIKKVITETLHERGIDKAHVKATDKGALDCTIRARVTAAAVRATGHDVWKD